MIAESGSAEGTTGMTQSSRIKQWSAPWGTDGAEDLTGSTNNGLTAASAQAVTTTKPASDMTNGRFVLDLTTVESPVHLAAIFLSTNAANETYSVKIWGWTQWGNEWVPNELGELDCTAGALVGVSGSTGPDNSYFFADTITLVAGSDNTRGDSIEVNGGTDGDDAAEYITFDATGHTLIEFETSDDASATSVLVGIRVI